MKASSQASKLRAKHAPATQGTKSKGEAGRGQNQSPFPNSRSLLVDISTRFISLPADRVDSEIMLAQQQVCECLGLDISALWQTLPSGSLVSTHIYVPPDFSVPLLEMDAKDTFPWTMERLFKGETIIISRMTDLPAAAARDLELYRYYTLTSAATFPLSAGGGPVFGAVSFNDFRKERVWSVELIEKLRIVAQIFASALARKRADQELRESEARYRGIFEQSIEGIYRSSLEGKILVANPAMAKMLGYASVEAAILDIADIGQQVWTDPEERSRFTRRLEEQGTIWGYECQFRRKDGTKIWVSLNSRSVFGPDGRIAYYEIFAADITERKQAEESLAKSQRLLAETEKIGKVGGWEIDLDTRKLTWTPEIYSIHEVDRTFEPTVEKGIQFYAPASRPVIERLVHRAIEHAEPFDVELEIITAKGNLRTVHGIGRADPEHGRVYGFFQDITALEQNEREMAQLRLELTHLSRVLTLNEISGSLAHEINQPLCAILSNAEAAKVLLSQEQDKQEDIPEIVDDIIQDARRAGDVVRTLRKLVKKGDEPFDARRLSLRKPPDRLRGAAGPHGAAPGGRPRGPAGAEPGSAGRRGGLRRNGTCRPRKPVERIQRYHAFAGRHEEAVARSLLCLGFTFPGLVLAEDLAALGVLAARPEVDPDRLGCCGLSGGGLRTVYLAGMDDSLDCAVAVGFMSTWRDFALHTSFAHTWMLYPLIRRSTWTFPRSSPCASRCRRWCWPARGTPCSAWRRRGGPGAMLADIYAQAGAEGKGRMSFHPGPHQFNRAMQEEAFAWLDRWLKG